MLTTTITFGHDGRVRVQQYEDGEFFSVETDANKLVSKLPPPMFQQIQAQVGEFFAILNATGPARQLKAVK